MLFAVHALDASTVHRQPHEALHKAHLSRASEFGVRLVAGGPLLSDDGRVGIGSLMIFDAAARPAVEAYVEADPYRREGVWGEVRIARFERKTWTA